MAEYFDNTELREVKSCGFFVMKPDRSFLLMKDGNRYDLPKGHMEAGETELQTALRELQEETGINAADIDIDPSFRFEHVYYPTYKRFRGEKVKKTIVVFLARLKSESVKIMVTEHCGFDWIQWTSPPTPIELKTVDALVDKVHAYLNG